MDHMEGKEMQLHSSSVAWTNSHRLLSLFLLAGLISECSYAGERKIGVLEFDAVVELSREIPWFDAAKGSIVLDRIVERLSLICSGTAYCNLTVVSFPRRNCASSRGEPIKNPLESTQAGADVAVYERREHGSGDLAVSRPTTNSVLLEFSALPLIQSKDSIVVTFKDRFGPSGSKIPTRITGSQTLVSNNTSGPEVVTNVYRDLPASTVCSMPMQSGGGGQ
jgi:hypothetical protein